MQTHTIKYIQFGCRVRVVNQDISQDNYEHTLAGHHQ